MPSMMNLAASSISLRTSRPIGTDSPLSGATWQQKKFRQTSEATGKKKKQNSSLVALMIEYHDRNQSHLPKTLGQEAVTQSEEVFILTRGEEVRVLVMDALNFAC
jgi:hypothetical protein